MGSHQELSRDKEGGACWVSLRDGCIMPEYVLAGVLASVMLQHVGFPDIRAAMWDRCTHGQWGGEKPSPMLLRFCCYLSHLCMGSDCSTVLEP